MNATWVLLKCHYCGKPLVEISGEAAVRMRCSDRGCRLWSNFEVTASGTVRAVVVS